MDPIVWIDTETTSLDPERGEVWDIAIIEADGTEHEWHIRPQYLHNADDAALRVGRFYERVAAAGYTEEQVAEGYPAKTRTVKRPNFWNKLTPGQIASSIAVLTANKSIAGMNPAFDIRFLAGLLRREGFTPAWNYTPVDVRDLAIGFARGRQRNSGHERPKWVSLPWSTQEIAKYLDINLESDQFEKHTAIGDARLARAIYTEVMEGWHVE